MSAHDAIAETRANDCIHTSRASDERAKRINERVTETAKEHADLPNDGHLQRAKRNTCFEEERVGQRDDGVARNVQQSSVYELRGKGMPQIEASIATIWILQHGEEEHRVDIGHWQAVRKGTCSESKKILFIANKFKH